MRLLRRAGFVLGGFFLVMLGVNVAPTVYGWQGYAYDWTVRHVRPTPPGEAELLAARAEAVAEAKQYVDGKLAEVKQLRADILRVSEEAKKAPAPRDPDPDLLARLDRAEARPPAAPDADLARRLEQLELDHKSLVSLQMNARKDLIDMQEKAQQEAERQGAPPQPVQPGPDLDEPDGKLGALAVRAGLEEPKSTIRNPRRPTTINNKQRAWVRQLDNYKELHKSMTDLQIMNRYGWAGVFEMSDAPTQCAPGDPNCPVHRR